MSFDLIEEFRAPFEDRMVLGMIGRGFQPEVEAGGLLRTATKRRLVRGFTRHWFKPTRWCSRSVTPSGILAAQARRLGEVYGGEGARRAYRMRW